MLGVAEKSCLLELPLYNRIADYGQNANFRMKHSTGDQFPVTDAKIMLHPPTANHTPPAARVGESISWRVILVRSHRL